MPDLFGHRDGEGHHGSADCDFRHVTPTELLCFSALVSWVALLGVLALQGRLAALRGWGVRDLAFSALLGLINPFLYYLVLFYAVIAGLTLSYVYMAVMGRFTGGGFTSEESAQIFGDLTANPTATIVLTGVFLLLLSYEKT